MTPPCKLPANTIIFLSSILKLFFLNLRIYTQKHDDYLLVSYFYYKNIFKLTTLRPMTLPLLFGNCLQSQTITGPDNLYIGLVV